MFKYFIIFDFEVFKYDTLLGAIIYDVSSKEISYFQTRDLLEIKRFYEEHEKDCRIGHNIKMYDNHILLAILESKDPYETSQNIINNKVRYKSNFLKYYYDLMDSNDFYSLKESEAAAGENIEESKVSFDIDRPLTNEEKELTNKYNRADLERSFKNFLDKDKFGKFRAKFQLVDMFKLSFNDINKTEAQLASKVLNAKRINGIEHLIVKPSLYPNLLLNNKDLLSFYFSEGFRNNKKLNIKICDQDISIGSGGIHSAILKCHYEKALYIDVSGYYNLIMINYDLLPRSISKEDKERYKEMYQQQLIYKKTDPLKREPLKIILLSVFGAMNNEYSDFYDPQHGSLVTITGELFLCDLLEKLEGKIELIQANTDGIIIKPNRREEEKEVISIIEEREKRTNFTCKKEYIYDLYQRDVNNYMYKDEKNNINVRGEALKQYASRDRLFYEGKVAFRNKEPSIISIGIVDYFMNKKLPQEIVEENKNNLIYFQQICKKGSFEYTTLNTFDFYDNLIKEEKLQGVNRIFAKKIKDTYNSIIKHKQTNGKHLKTKVANLPPSVLVYDSCILENINDLIKEIDYNYYVNRIYERINEFINIKKVKDILI